MLGLGNTYDLVPAIIPVDLNTAANNGDWVSLKNAQYVDIVLLTGVGAVGEPPVLTLKQAVDVAGTSAKALTVITTAYTKTGALLTAVGVWAKVTQAVLATFTPAAGNVQALSVVHVESDMLDADNGFDCIQLSVPDVGGTAQLGCGLYILGGLRFPSTPANLPNSIVD